MRTIPSVALLILLLLSPPGRCAEADPEEPVARARATARLIAETAAKFEADAARPPRGPEELRRFLGPEFRFSDPWGAPWRFDFAAGIVHSAGPDGLFATTGEAALDDIRLAWREPSFDPALADLRATAEPLRDALVAFRERETREIATLADLETTGFTGAVSLRDPWDRPFRLDPDRRLLLSGGPDGDFADGALAFSYDTASDELKSIATLLRLRDLAGSIEARLRDGLPPPDALLDLFPEPGETAEAALRDPWGAPFAYDTAAAILASTGPDGMSDPRRPETLLDDLRAGFAATTAEATRAARARELVRELGRATLLHRIFTAEMPVTLSSLVEAGRLPADFPPRCPYDAPWRFDTEKLRVGSVGPDSAAGGDDIAYDLNPPSPDEAGAATGEAVRFLATALARHEADRNTVAVNLLQLAPREAPDIFRMRDPWGNPFHLDPDLRLVYSMGPDGRRALSPDDPSRADDITAPVVAVRPATKPQGGKGTEDAKKKGKGPGR